MALVLFCLGIYHIIYGKEVVIMLCSLGFSLVLAALSIAFEWMADMDDAFMRLTKAIADNTTQLVKVLNMTANRSSSINLTFTGTQSQWLSPPSDLDMLSLSELHYELNEAVKKEDYDRAALIRDKIQKRIGS